MKKVFHFGLVAAMLVLAALQIIGGPEGLVSYYNKNSITNQVICLGAHIVVIMGIPMGFFYLPMKIASDWIGQKKYP